MGAAWATPAYDRNGNMTSIPQPAAPTATYPAVFDAWNRLVALTGTATMVMTAFIAARFRPVSGGSTRYFYLQRQWQVLDEYVGTSGARPALRLGPALHGRPRSAGPRNHRNAGAALRLAGRQLERGGDLQRLGRAPSQERYAYTAYGVVMPLNPDFSAAYMARAYDWTVLYTGRALDDESGLYYYRMRYYHPGLGVFVNRDVLGTRKALTCTGTAIAPLLAFSIRRASLREGLISVLPLRTQ